MIQCGILVGLECLQVNGRGIARHGGEFLPGDKPAAVSQRDQFCDPVTIPGDREGLPVLDGIHDLPRSRPQVALGNLRVRIHESRVAPGAILCHLILARLLAVGISLLWGAAEAAKQLDVAKSRTPRQPLLRQRARAGQQDGPVLDVAGCWLKSSGLTHNQDCLRSSTPYVRMHVYSASKP